MSNLTKKTNKPKTILFRNKSLAETSKINYIEGVNQFLAYLDKTGQKETAESVNTWIKEIKKTKAPATFNLRVQSVKEYLSEKYKNDHKQLFGIYELFKTVKKAKVQKSILKDAYLTLEQVEELSHNMTYIMSFISQALFWTGVRVSELVNIKLDDIKLNGKAIIKIRSGKEYLFETKNGTQYNTICIHREIKRQGKRFGYEISPHTYRHSKAMYLKDVRGLSADQIAKALGHAIVVTTLESYFHGTPSAEDQGIENVDILKS